jgi:hypothetical protein
VQGGIRVRAAGHLGELAEMKPEKSGKRLVSQGFHALAETQPFGGGMVVPQHHIDEIKAQEDRD